MGWNKIFIEISDLWRSLTKPGTTFLADTHFLAFFNRAHKHSLGGGTVALTWPQYERHLLIFAIFVTVVKSQWIKENKLPPSSIGFTSSKLLSLCATSQLVSTSLLWLNVTLEFNLLPKFSLGPLLCSWNILLVGRMLDDRVPPV